MHLLIDLILVVLVLLTALISAKQGFVKIAVEVAGFVVAVLIALSISQPLADFTYQKTIEPAILNSVTDIAQDSTATSVNEIWDNLPKFIQNNADKMGVSKESLQTTISHNTQDTLKTTITNISQNVLKPAISGILETVFSVILIIVLLFLVRILAKLINKVFSFSVVGKLNRVLGGTIGIVKGMIIAFLVCEIIVLIISLTDNGIWIFNNENIQKTFIFKFLINLF